jgi:hypothetical protein
MSIGLLMLCAIAATSSWVWHEQHAEAASWTEDVVLADRTLVKVRVSVIGSVPYGELGGPGGARHEAYEISGLEGWGVQQKWRGDRGAPIAIDRTKDGEWYVISAAVSCEDFARLGRDQGPYAEYRYRSGAWVRIPLPLEHVNRKSNLMLADERASGHFTLEKKARVRSGQGPLGRYDTVLSVSNSNC